MTYKLFLYLFLSAFILTTLSQNKNEIELFDKAAEKINIIIAKSLIEESKDNLLKGVSTYSEFIEVKKQLPPKNKDIADSIEVLKERIKKEQNLDIIKKLHSFKVKAIQLIPSKKSTDDQKKREQTIANIEKEINSLIDLISMSLNQKQEESLQVKQQEQKKIPNKRELDLYDLILLILLAFIIITVVWIIYKVYRIYSKVILSSNQIYKFIKETKSQNNETPNFNNSINSRLRSVTDYNKILMDLSEIINSSVKKAISDYILLEKNSNSKKNNEFSYESNDIIKAITVKYAESPEREGFFDESLLTSKQTPRSLYKIFYHPDSQLIEFDIIESNESLHRNAMNNPNGLLKPACIYDRDPSINDKIIINQNSCKGKLIKEGNKLKIKEKIVIIFQ